MTSTYSVGDIVRTDDLDALPNGIKLEFTDGGLRVTEVPAATERDMLAVELWNIGHPGIPKSHVNELIGNRDTYERLADHVLSNFVRKGAETPGTENPTHLVDGDGDAWFRLADGTYVTDQFTSLTGGGDTLDYIRDHYKIRRAWTEHPASVGEQSPDALIDCDGDRWERQPDGMYRMRKPGGGLCEDSQTRDYIEREYSPLRAA